RADGAALGGRSAADDVGLAGEANAAHFVFQHTNASAQVIQVAAQVVHVHAKGLQFRAKLLHKPAQAIELFAGDEVGQVRRGRRAATAAAGDLVADILLQLRDHAGDDDGELVARHGALAAERTVRVPDDQPALREGVHRVV